MSDDRFYFRQLLAGADFAESDLLAQQMVNFSYLIGDRESGECLVVDPAYGVAELKSIAESDGMTIAGALVTHYHPDHCGGDMMGMRIEGVTELLALQSMPVHVQADEAEYVLKVTDLEAGDLVQHSSGDKVSVGEVDVTLLHTPGHTPGSQCFLVENNLVAGDTLFLQGCGRTDLPGGDPAQLYESITTRLAKVPDTATLFPGHLYSPKPSEQMGEVRRSNMVFKPRSASEWLRIFGS
ncbi:MAG: MBL fold metallo-hydrolase [Actinomycetia bacterium]|nr:MBL fold metallo-hydrolase [Actinomycetes bacterium]